MPEPDTPRRPTMADVAAAAGVSVMTVSYAFNQPDRVAEETRRRVLATAQRLEYGGPSPTARSLRRRRTGAIGVILGEPLGYAFDDYQATRFLSGVAQVCTEHNLSLMLLPITGHDSDADLVARAAVDGFVVWTTTDDALALEAVMATRLPVAIHGGPARDGATLVGIDDRAAARAIGRAVFAGKNRPSVVSFPLDGDRRSLIVRGIDPYRSTFPVTRNRLLGFRDACNDLGHDWADVTIGVCARNTRHDGRTMTRQLLDSSPAPDALAAMYDELALGAVQVAADRGIAIPGDLAISGWDDTPAAATAGVTTIHQDLRDHGACCATAATAQPSAPRWIEQPWQLVIRDTTST